MDKPTKPGYYLVRFSDPKRSLQIFDANYEEGPADLVEELGLYQAELAHPEPVSAAEVLALLPSRRELEAIRQRESLRSDERKELIRWANAVIKAHGGMARVGDTDEESKTLQRALAVRTLVHALEAAEARMEALEGKAVAP